MDPFVSTIISIAFLISGGIAVYTMMARLGRKDISNPDKHRILHKVFGWLFVGLFIIMFIFMLERVENYWEESSPRISLHVALSVALFLLLIIKVAIPIFFKMLGKHLFLIGISVYLSAFILVTITAGYYVIWKYENEPYISHADIPERMKDEKIGKELFITKCSTCHLLREIMKPRSGKAWEEIVNEMVSLAEPRITLAEASQILHYLTLTHTPEPVDSLKGVSPIERHCLPCHETRELYVNQYGESGWREVVAKMNQYDSEIVPLEKMDEIVSFLLNKQREINQF